MKKGLTVAQIVEICKGKLYCGSNKVICENFVKDTRQIAKNDTYIGIKGAKFDGNAFYQDAFAKGANCCILESEFAQNNAIEATTQPIIIVENTIAALRLLALYKRDHSGAKVIGVTGSVGKTSTRDMIYSVVKTHFKSLKTEGNYNNNIGLPLTLLRLSDEEAAVIEMGMNHLGEIDYLTKIAKPHISVITNVGTAHIGELGGRENILKAKLEIINGMDKDGILIVNNDNDLLHTYVQNAQNINIVTIGIDEKSDFMATDIDLKETSSTFKIKYQSMIYDVYVPVPGRVFIYNSLVAFAVGMLLNINPKQIIAGIKNFELTKNRLEYLNLSNNITIINDAYNASVDSMKSSLEILGKYTSRKIAVLGDMLELGEYAKQLHEEVGEYVQENNIDILITVGQEAQNIAAMAVEKGMLKDNVYTFLTNDEALLKIKELIKAHDVILFKASNGMHFNEIITKLKETMM